MHAPNRRDLLFAMGGAVAGGLLARQFLPASDGVVSRYLDHNPAFLADHPAYLDAASSTLETRARAGEAGQRRTLLADQWLGKTDWLSCPRLGPLNGDVGLIEFTDYFCPPCRGTAGAIEAALGADPSRAVILMLVPISGALSTYVAGFAAACYFLAPAPFVRLHADLLTGSPPNQQRIEKLAVKRGYEVDAVLRNIDTPKVRRYLTLARQFAEVMEVTGFPTLINTQGELRRGAVTAEQAIGMMRRNRPKSMGGS